MRPAYITAMVSTVSATTARSCVISSRAVPVRAWSALINSRIWAWIVTSSAVVAHPAMSSFGLQESAIAIMALAHAAGQLVRVLPYSPLGSGDTYQAERLDRPLHPFPLEILGTVWSRMASEIWSPIVKTGLRLVIGSWKIIAISRL